VFRRRLRPEFEWERPPSAPFPDELSADDFQRVDLEHSDFPPEVDFEQLLGWMRAVTEQGPPGSWSTRPGADRRTTGLDSPE
jgi:hypothetical protein